MGIRRYEGHDGARAGFAELDRVVGPGKRVRVWPRRHCLDHTDPDKVVVLVAISVTQPDSREFGAASTLLVTMRGDKIAGYRALASFEEGLGLLEDPFEIEP